MLVSVLVDLNLMIIFRDPRNLDSLVSGIDKTVLEVFWTLIISVSADVYTVHTNDANGKD